LLIASSYFSQQSNFRRNNARLLCFQSCWLFSAAAFVIFSLFAETSFSSSVSSPQFLPAWGLLFSPLSNPSCQCAHVVSVQQGHSRALFVVANFVCKGCGLGVFRLMQAAKPAQAVLSAQVRDCAKRLITSVCSGLC